MQKRKDLVTAPGLMALNQEVDDVKTKSSNYTKLHESGACVRRVAAIPSSPAAGTAGGLVCPCRRRLEAGSR